jgi:queuosine precursor transporter
MADPHLAMDALKSRLFGVVALAVFVGMIVLSNYLLQHFGILTLPGVGWGVPAGTFCAAITWPARDVFSRVSGPRWGPWLGLVAVFVGAGIAWLISPTLAVASAVAYLCSEGTDWGIFWALGGQRVRGARYAKPVGISTVVAAFVDSVVFLNLAGIPWGEAGPGLLLAKWATVLLAAYLLRRRATDRSDEERFERLRAVTRLGVLTDYHVLLPFEHWETPSRPVHRIWEAQGEGPRIPSSSGGN